MYSVGTVVDQSVNSAPLLRTPKLKQHGLGLIFGKDKTFDSFEKGLRILRSSPSIAELREKVV